MDIDNLIRAASTAHASNQFGEASRLCSQVLAIEPYNVQALMIAGVIEAKVGDPLKAIRLLDEVQGIEPDSFHAAFWQSHVYKKLGKIPEAIHSARRAVELNPQDAQALAQLGICLLEVRLLPESEERLRQATFRAPQVIPILYSLSQCLHLQGRRDEASDVIRRALSGSQHNADSLLKLAQFLLSQNNPTAAQEVARRALQLQPSSDVAKLLLARLLLEDSQSAEAEDLLKQAMARQSKDHQVYGMMGTAIQALGRIDEAIRCFQQSIALEPNQGYAYFAIANSKKMGEEDRGLVEQMQKLASKSNLPPKQASFLQYGIAKSLEDLSDFAGSIAAYDEANRIEYELKFKDGVFDDEAYSDRFDRTIRQFSTSFVKRNAGAGSASSMPIFVVGMMRSGTTLIEQVLSSHPEVGAAGEQTFWGDNWRSGLNEMKGELNVDGLNEAANRYVALLQSIAPSKSHVVDKMPINYAGLGIIHLAFPNAKIIHVMRDPVDTCFSIYATPNRALTEFAHNRRNIVSAYGEYLKIMKHWRKALPPESMLEIQYENLVSNSEPETRKLVEFCGLEWNDACLRPHENKRAVITPSVWQVRQPFYKSSIQRWRKFEAYLGEFKDLLPDA